MTITAAIGLGVFAVIALINVAILLRNWKTARAERSYPAVVPLIGGCAGLAGCLTHPPLQPYAWAPLLLDPGTAGFVLFALPATIRERWQFSALNLLREFHASGNPAKNGTLRLYKGGQFSLRLDFHRARNEAGIGQFTRLGTWTTTPSGINLTTRDAKSAELVQNDKNQAGVLVVASDFPTFQIDADLALAGLIFTEQTQAAAHTSPISATRRP